MNHVQGIVIVCNVQEDFQGVISQNPSVSKYDQSHAVIFWFFIELGVFPKVLNFN